MSDKDLIEGVRDVSGRPIDREAVGLVCGDKDHFCSPGGGGGSIKNI
jgi:hypothetical protein